MNKALISFGGSTVAVTHDGTAAARVLDFLFGDVPAAAGEPHLAFHLEPSETGDNWQLDQGDT